MGLVLEESQLLFETSLDIRSSSFTIPKKSFVWIDAMLQVLLGGSRLYTCAFRFAAIFIGSHCIVLVSLRNASEYCSTFLYYQDRGVFYTLLFDTLL